MKKCLAELMKELKAIQFDIDDIIKTESAECMYTYTKGESCENKTDYDYKTVCDRLSQLYGEQRHIKGIISKANSNTLVVGYNFTIAEGLVQLAQLNNNIKRLNSLADKKAITEEPSRVWGKEGTIIITATSYDPKAVKDDLKAAQRELGKLQVAIDRTNMLTMVTY